METQTLDQLLKLYRDLPGKAAPFATLESDVWARIQRRSAPREAFEFPFGRLQPLASRVGFVGATVAILTVALLGAQVTECFDTAPDRTLRVFSDQSPYLMANLISDSS